jgi:hypothetical protein
MLLAFMIVNTFWRNEGFTSGLRHNTNHKNTELGMKSNWQH